MLLQHIFKFDMCVRNLVLFFLNGVSDKATYFHLTFLVCMEGFTTVIKEYEKKKLIRGIQVARVEPSLSHMFFLQMTVIFTVKQTALKMTTLLTC